MLREINMLTNISMLTSEAVSLAGLKECHLVQPWHLRRHRWTITGTSRELGWITQRTIKSSTRWATTSTPQWSCIDGYNQNTLFQLINTGASTLNALQWNFDSFASITEVDHLQAIGPHYHTKQRPYRITLWQDKKIFYIEASCCTTY
jgi:hypothetical protein